MEHGSGPCICAGTYSVTVLLTTTLSWERPLCDCPKLANIFDKCAPSRLKPLILLVKHSNPRQINLDHWQCGTNVTKTFHSERLIILIVQRNHDRKCRQNSGSRGRSHIGSCNMVKIYHHVLRRSFTKIHASCYFFFLILLMWRNIWLALCDILSMPGLQMEIY